jgi:uncharacterized protein (DUF2252 family)
MATAAPPASRPTHRTPEERAATGKAARAVAPRSQHAIWEPDADRPDPIGLLDEQAVTRVPELVPIRHGRMAESAFAFFRGAAYVMASDLAHTPQTGLAVQLCGDAHLSNFGGFASPERQLVFDLNDFDETHPGPWEWDVKRLLASLAVAGRARGFDRKQRRRIIRAAGARYRTAMREFAGARTLDVWYARMDEGELESYRSQVSAAQAKRYDKTVAKGRAKNSTRAFEKLATYVNGDARILPDPPLVMPVEDVFAEAEARDLEDMMRSLMAAYRDSLPRERQALMDRYRYAHAARKVVGVGSVGTRAWIILMLGRDQSDPLFLQAKEAGPSVLEPFTGPCEFDNQGRRVVEGQRLTQAASDPLLGWVRIAAPEGGDRDFYVRQLWDWKTSAAVETMEPGGLEVYARMCAWTLARAHARSGDPIAIGAYLGGGESCDRALADFAEAYADQNERDYRAFLEAIDGGRLAAAGG